MTKIKKDWQVFVWVIGHWTIGIYLEFGIW
jgi:hypothetical protein